jgi:phosphate transport system permease protein
MPSAGLDEDTSPPGHAGDRIFKGLATGAGVVIVLALAGVGIFLTYEGFPAFTATKTELGGEGVVAYIWPLVFGTLLGAVIALLIAAPLSRGGGRVI